MLALRRAPDARSLSAVLGRPLLSPSQLRQSGTAPVVLALVCSTCSTPEVPLPEPVFSQLPGPPCFDAGPPNVMVLSSPSDPGACLSTSNRERSVKLLVSVTRAGRATEVDVPLLLCVEEGPDGKILPPVELSVPERACLLEQLASWRFAAYDTCAHQTAWLELPSRHVPRQLSATASSPGGPTSGCS